MKDTTLRVDRNIKVAIDYIILRFSCLIPTYSLLQVEVLLNTSIASIEGMALDPISKLLYFVDGSKKTIELLKTDSPSKEHIMRKTILSNSQLGSTSRPRGVAVHPAQVIFSCSSLLISIYLSN